MKEVLYDEGLHNSILSSMRIHERIKFKLEDGFNVEVVKVIGGWIYYYLRLEAGVCSSTFVPEKL